MVKCFSKHVFMQETGPIFVLEENNYSAAYYFYDACLVVALLISLKLKVSVGDPTVESNENNDKKKKEHRKALKQLFSWPALIFFGIIFHGGLLWGIHDTYISIYLQEEL